MYLPRSLVLQEGQFFSSCSEKIWDMVPSSMNKSYLTKTDLKLKYQRGRCWQHSPSAAPLLKQKMCILCSLNWEGPSWTFLYITVDRASRWFFFFQCSALDILVFPFNGDDLKNNNLYLEKFLYLLFQHFVIFSRKCHLDINGE